MSYGKNKHLNTILVQEKLPEVYDSVEFNLTTGQTNYDVRTNVTGTFVNFDFYTTINVRTDQNITVRFNDVDNSAITVVSGRPFELDNLMKITNIFITNASGSTAAIKILCLQKGE